MTEGPPAVRGEPATPAPAVHLAPAVPRGPAAAQRQAQGLAAAAVPLAQVPATWQAAPRLRRLAIIGVAVVLVAVLTRHADLLLLGAPVLAALAAARRGTRPDALDAAVTTAPSRCFEGEEVEIVATVAVPADEVTFRIEPGPAVTLIDGPVTQVAVAAEPASARWVLQPHAWGRHQLCTVTARCTDGMGQASLTLQPGRVEVFPHPPPARPPCCPTTCCGGSASTPRRRPVRASSSSAFAATSPVTGCAT